MIFARKRECVCERTNVMFYFMHVMYTHTGPQGEKGELGPTGPPGLPGEKGARGKQGKRVSFSEVLQRTTTDQIDRTNHSLLNNRSSNRPTFPSKLWNERTSSWCIARTSTIPLFHLQHPYSTTSPTDSF